MKKPRWNKEYTLLTVRLKKSSKRKKNLDMIMILCYPN